MRGVGILTTIGLADVGDRGPIGARAFAWGANDSVFTTTLVNYYPYSVGFSSNNGTAIGIEVDVPGYLANLFVQLDSNAADTDYTFTIYKNGVATALAVTVTAGSTTTASDTTHAVSVVAGDIITMHSSRPAGTFGIGHGPLFGACERVAT